MPESKAPEILRSEAYLNVIAMTCPVRYVASLFFMVLKKIALYPKFGIFYLTGRG